jgi:hypothetical protein
MHLFRVFIILILFFQLQSCQKVIDKFLDPVNGDQKKCIITKVVRSGDETGVVTSNSHGNPLSVKYNVQGYDNNWHYFKYDDQQRLEEYRVELQPDLDIEIHKYGYDELDRVIADTGTFRLTGYIVVLSTFEYDSRNRIIKENQEVIDIEEGSQIFEIEPIFYNYNDNGNLINPLPQGDPVSYDNKTNFLRTNKVWMLIERNYSLNNKLGATLYNDYSLPLQFENSFVGFLGTAVIGFEYQCE